MKASSTRVSRLGADAAAASSACASVIGFGRGSASAFATPSASPPSLSSNPASAPSATLASSAPSATCAGKKGRSPRWRPPRTIARLTQAGPPCTFTAKISASWSRTFSIACCCSICARLPIWSRTWAACSNASCSACACMRCSSAVSKVSVWPRRKAAASCASRA